MTGVLWRVCNLYFLLPVFWRRKGEEDGEDDECEWVDRRRLNSAFGVRVRGQTDGSANWAGEDVGGYKLGFVRIFECFFDAIDVHMETPFYPLSLCRSLSCGLLGLGISSFRTARYMCKRIIIQELLGTIVRTCSILSLETNAVCPQDPTGYQTSWTGC